MEKIRILSVEDDFTTAKYLTEFLETHGFEVSHTDTTTSALSYLRLERFDMILLDLSLPDFDGFELLREHAAQTIPIIVISAYSDTATKIRAFRYGAIDYLVKPIDLLELEARIWAHLGRQGKLSGPQESTSAHFYLEDGQIFCKGKPLNLTQIEAEIFTYLIKNRNRTVSRERLTEALSAMSSHRTLDYHIKNIRTKIGDTRKPPRYLKTEYGIGYRLEF